MKLYFYFYVFVIIFFINNAYAERDILIKDAWIRAAPPNIHTHAGYLVIINNNPEEIELTNITSEDYERVEIHLTRMVNEIAMMDKIDSIKIPSNSEFNFTPGKYHLMLINNNKNILPGDTIRVNFIFNNKSMIPVSMIIKQDDPEHHYNHSH